MLKILIRGLPDYTGALFYLTALSGRIPSVCVTYQTSTYSLRRVCWTFLHAERIHFPPSSFSMSGDQIPVGGRDFPHLSRPALGPTQPPVQWVPGLPGDKERPWRDADPSPPSSAMAKKE